MIDRLRFAGLCMSAICLVAGCNHSKDPATANVPRDVGADSSPTGKVTVAIHVKDMCERLDLF